MSGVSSPSKVRVAGPLVGYAPGFVVVLEVLGYQPSSASCQMGLFAALSRWLRDRGLGPGDLDGDHIDLFLTERRLRGSNLYSLQALGPALSYLRGLGVVPAPGVAVPNSQVDELLAGFAAQLAVTAPVATAYQRYVRPFLEWLEARNGSADLGGLDARTVTMGRKDRATPLDHQTVTVLTSYIQDLAPTAGNLFPTRTGTRMSTDALATRLTAASISSAVPVRYQLFRARNNSPILGLFRCPLLPARKGPGTLADALWRLSPVGIIGCPHGTSSSP